VDQTHDYEIACERYLLGEMSEQEQERLEQKYFEDEALFERFLAVKDDLVDAYARGELRADKRKRFEQHFLATQPRRDRAKDAAQFMNAITSVAGDPAKTALQHPSTQKRSWWQSLSETIGLPPLVFQGALAALLLAAIVGGWLWMRSLQRREVEKARLQNEETQRQQAIAGEPSNSSTNGTLPDVAKDQNANPDNSQNNGTVSPSPSKVNRRAPQMAPAQVASLTLSPFAARDGSNANSLIVSPHTRTVRLRLAFKEGDYRSYDVILRTLEGKQVTHRRSLNAASNGSGKSLTLNLDAALLSQQDYIVTLNGLTKAGQSEAIAEYYFRVQRSAARSSP